MPTWVLIICLLCVFTQGVVVGHFMALRRVIRGMPATGKIGQRKWYAEDGQ